MAVKSNYKKDCDLTSELFERFNETTPDWLDRKLEDNIAVFVYGHEMTGEKNFPVLKNSIYLGEGYTCTQSFILEVSETDVPVAFETNQISTACNSILGEVFLVSPKVLLNLDMYSANNEMFVRKQKFVFLAEQTVKTTGRFRPSVKAWMYVGKTDFWEDQNTTKIKSREVFNRRVYGWSRKFEDDDIPNFLLQDRKVG